MRRAKAACETLDSQPSTVDARQRSNALLQINLAQLGVVVQLGGGAGERNAAVSEDINAVGDLEDLADFLLDDQDGDAVVAT